jgi:hypothetical protein
MPIETRPVGFAAPPAVRRARRLFLGLSLVVAVWIAGSASTSARADTTAPEFFVVVNARNPSSSVDREFLSDAFLKRTTRWSNGVAIRPADQRPDAPVRHAFSKVVLKRSVAAVRNYWQQRIFSGKDIPPPELESDAAVMHYVAKYEGGVGYVSSTATLEGVKVVSIR